MKSRNVGLWLVKSVAILMASSALAVVPNAPANLKPGWVDDLAVVLTWDETAGAETFRVYRYDQSTAGWNLIQENVTVPMFREMPPNAPPLQYAVTAVNTDGESEAAIVTVETGGWASTTIMVYPPDGSWGTLTETNAVISFASSIMSGTDGLLELGTSMNALEFYEYQAAYETWHNFQVTDLQPGTEYFYRLTITEPSRLGLTYVSSFVTIPANEIPVAQDVTVQQVGEWSTSIPLTGSNAEPWQPLSARLVTLPTKGNVIALYENGYGNWTALYEPAQGARGTDTFQFVFSDGIADSAIATATITDIYMNQAPVAMDLQAATFEDSPVEIGLAATDADGDPLTYAITFASDGSFELVGTNLVLTPAENFSGTVWLIYQVSDGVSYAYGDVEVSVSPVNDTPVAADRSVFGTEDNDLSITLSGTDPEWDQLTYEIILGPEQGTLTGEPPYLVYVPGANFNGADTISYVVSDGVSTSQVASITIEISPINDAPLANSQSISTSYNTPVGITLTASDTEGSTLSYLLGTTPANGVLSGTAPNLTFTPNIGWSGTTTFDFSVSDGQDRSELATVSISVAPASAVPFAPTGLLATAVSRTQINLSWNDTSIDEDGFKIERYQNGWVQIATVGPNVRTFSSTGLSANKNYQFRVRGFNVLGNSGYSNTASARTLK